MRQLSQDPSMPQTLKHHIDVTVRTAYIDQQSAPDDNRYVFAYTSPSPTPVPCQQNC